MSAELPQTTPDWISLSKTLVIEAVFVASSAFVLTGHTDGNIVAIVWATGATLGVLRVADIAANAVNFRSFLRHP